jgi:hypothetical protein
MAPRGSGWWWGVSDSVAWFDLSETEREAIQWWLREHHVDPNQTPLDGLLGYDETTGEWRIRQYCRSPEGAHRYLVDGEVATKVIRRRELLPLPWRAK